MPDRCVEIGEPFVVAVMGYLSFPARYARYYGASE